jgi:hypothetical protein
MRYFFAAVTLLLVAATAAGQTAPVTLAATPSTVIWGYYSAKAKPVLNVHLEIQSASRHSPPAVPMIGWKKKASRQRTFLLTTPIFIARSKIGVRAGIF